MLNLIWGSDSNDEQFLGHWILNHIWYFDAFPFITKLFFTSFLFFFFRVVFIFHTASKQFNEKTMDVVYNFHFSLTLIALMISRFNGGFTLHVAVVALARI